MAINLSSFDDSVIYQINPALHVSYFVVLCLPALILSSLCALALLVEKTININIRIILLNIFAAELSQLLGVTALFLGHPARLQDEETVNYSCNFFFSGVFCGALVKLPAIALYTIVVYIYIRHGDGKLKWYVTIMCCVPFWAITMPVAILPYTSVYGVISNRGFCYGAGDSPVFSILISSTSSVLFILSVSLTVTFGSLTFRYVKQNAMSRQAHKGVIRLLIYLIAGFFITFFNNVSPPIISRINDAIEDSVGVTGELVLYYIANAIIVFPVVLTPIFTIILVKPVRDTLKRACLCSNKARAPVSNRRCTFRSTKTEYHRSATTTELAMNPLPAMYPKQAIPDRLESTLHPKQATSVELETGMDPKQATSVELKKGMDPKQALSGELESVMRPELALSVELEPGRDPKQTISEELESTMHSEQVMSCKLEPVVDFEQAISEELESAMDTPVELEQAVDPEEIKPVDLEPIIRRKQDASADLQPAINPENLDPEQVFPKSVMDGEQSCT